MDETKSNSQIIKPVLGVILTLLALIFAFYAMGWFSNSKKVTANGMNVTLASAKAINIYASKDDMANNRDITNKSATKHLFENIQTPNSEQIYPGCSGNFTFYIKNGDDDNNSQSSILIKPTVSPGAMIFDENTSSFIINDKIKKYKKAGTDNEFSKYDDYLTGHILLFKNKDEKTGKYSGWIDSFDGTSIDYTSLEPITLYWVWVEYFYKLSDYNFIAERDSENILKHYYENEENKQFNITNITQYLLDTRDANMPDLNDISLISRYYDFADEDLGRYINSCYFDLKFN